MDSKILLYLLAHGCESDEVTFFSYHPSSGSFSKFLEMTFGVSSWAQPGKDFLFRGSRLAVEKMPLRVSVIPASIKNALDEIGSCLRADFSAREGSRTIYFYRIE